MWDAGIDGRHYFTPWYDRYIHERAAHGRYVAHVDHWRQRHAYLLHLRDVAQRRQYLLYLRYEAEQAAAAAATTTTTLPYVAPTTVPYTTPAPAAPTPSYGGGGYVDPSSIPYPFGCVLSIESGGTNTSQGDGGGYFQFEPGTWAFASGLAWPPTMYSFQTQYSAALHLYAYQGDTLYPAWQDGC